MQTCPAEVGAAGRPRAHHTRRLTRERLPFHKKNPRRRHTFPTFVGSNKEGHQTRPGRGARMKTSKIGRREAMAAIGAAGAAVALGCGDSPASPSSTTTTTTPTTSTNTACAVTPTETIGPYPSLTDLFRSDVREGKQGAQLNLTIKVVNVAGGCSPVAGANVEIWHVDAAGNYSQYGTQTAQTYLRGIQTTNASGEVNFVT